MESVNDNNLVVGRPFPTRAVAGFILVAIVGVLYWQTLDNGLMPEELRGGDLITHQYAQVQGRPSNAPGYPLYTMGGWLWFHGWSAIYGAFGRETPNPIPILSSYSTVWALLAIWLFYLILCLVTARNSRPEGNWRIAFLVSLFYAVTYFFWYYATTTEQYSSAIAQTLAIVLVFLVWQRRMQNLWTLYLLAFLCGLSLAHMLTVAFIVPPIVIAVLWQKPDLLRTPKAVIGSVAVALLPLISYLFVYIRGSQHPEWWGSQQFDSTLEWFLSFVSTSQGREELMWAFEPGRPFFGNGFPALMGVELSWIVVAAGLIGIYLLQRPLRYVLYGTLLLYVLFSWAYRFGNWFQVILPAYALLLIGVGVLADRIERAGAGMESADGVEWPTRAWHNVLRVAPTVFLIVAIVWRFDASYGRANSSDRPEDTALGNAAILLADDLPPNSALFTSVDDALAIQYLTNIWGLRPDTKVVSSGEASNLLPEHSVFVTWDATNTLLEELNPALATQLSIFSPSWIELTSGDSSQKAWNGSYFKLGHNFADQVTLAGYSVSETDSLLSQDAATEQSYAVTLLWQSVDAKWPEGLSISVRPTISGDFIPTDSSGAIRQEDRPEPAQLRFDASNEQQDGLLVDPYRLNYPADVDRSELGIAVLLYRQEGGTFVDVGRANLPLLLNQ